MEKLLLSKFRLIVRSSRNEENFHRLWQIPDGVYIWPSKGITYGNGDEASRALVKIYQPETLEVGGLDGWEVTPRVYPPEHIYVEAFGELAPVRHLLVVDDEGLQSIEIVFQALEKMQVVAPPTGVSSSS